MSMQCKVIHMEPWRSSTFRSRMGILIPAYNEAEHLSGLLAACRAVKPALVLVVDDGSTDDTRRVLAGEMGCDEPGVLVASLRNPLKLGKQGSVRRGLLMLVPALHLDAVALIDGDGQHDPLELPALAQLIRQYHVVIGARSTAQMPLHRRLSNWMVNLGFRWIGGVDFVDVQSGLRIYRKEVADVLAAQLPTRGGYGLEHEALTIITRHAQQQGEALRIAATPCCCAYGQAESSMRAGNILQLAVETVRQAARIRRVAQATEGAM